MSDLHALIYVSTAVRQPTQADLDRLIARARVRNLEQGVTGLLLCAHGNFMQYLEGGEAGMATVYAAIQADPLHRGLVELLREPIQERVFEEWAMGFRSISAFGVANPVQLDRVFRARVDPELCTPKAAHTLLWNFWNKGSVGAGAMAIASAASRSMPVQART